MKIGYCCVSTDDQTPDWYLAALKRAGCQKICTGKATRAHVKRPALAKCFKALEAGDVLGAWKLDRLREEKKLIRMHHIYTDAQGESHFADIEVEYVETIGGGRLSKRFPVTSLMFRETQPAHYLDWPPAPWLKASKIMVASLGPWRPKDAVSMRLSTSVSVRHSRGRTSWLRSLVGE